MEFTPKLSNSFHCTQALCLISQGNSINSADILFTKLFYYVKFFKQESSIIRIIGYETCSKVYGDWHDIPIQYAKYHDLSSRLSRYLVYQVQSLYCHSPRRGMTLIIWHEIFAKVNQVIYTSYPNCMLNRILSIYDRSFREKIYMSACFPCW